MLDEDDEDYPGCVIEPLSTHHSLNHGYCFWFMQKDPTQTSRVMQAQEYEKSIKRVGTFYTVEGFWQIYNHMTRPNDIKDTTELHMFREGIKPIWEDAANKNGGKLILRLTKGLASRYWELCLLAVIGEIWEVSDEVCGLVISIRQNEDIIAIWNKTADNHAILNKLKECLKTTLNYPSWVRTEYKRHEKRLQRTTREQQHREASQHRTERSDSGFGRSGSAPHPSTAGGSSGWRLE